MDLINLIGYLSDGWLIVGTSVEKLPQQDDEQNGQKAAVEEDGRSTERKRHNRA